MKPNAIRNGLMYALFGLWGCGAQPAVTGLASQALEAEVMECAVAADPAGDNSKCDGTTTHTASYLAPAAPVDTGATIPDGALSKCVRWAMAHQDPGAAGKVDCGKCPPGCKEGGCEPYDIKGSDSADVKKRGSTYDCGTNGEIDVSYKCTKCVLEACTAEPVDGVIIAK